MKESFISKSFGGGGRGVNIGQCAIMQAATIIAGNMDVEEETPF